MLKKNCLKISALTIVVSFIMSMLYGDIVSFAGVEDARPKVKELTEFEKGMCYTTWSKTKYGTKESDESLKELAKTGTKWVSVTVTWYQVACNTTEIFPTVKTPSDESVIHAIQTIHSLGMKAMIKPHLELVDTSGGSWRGEIACAPEDWEKWFDSYKNFVLHYAEIAEQNKAEMFCVGTELSSIAVIKEDLWKDKIINPVRGIYKGPLTYAANWNEEYLNVVFWKEMDYVGIDAYFPLSDKDRPTLEEIKKGWEPWVKEMEEFQAKVNKPILFTEVGYCSAEGTTRAPWEEPIRTPGNLSLQADCYQALYEIFWNKDWLYGIYWWKWGPDVRMGGPENRSFTPQRKPAQKIVTKWYKKSTPKRKKSL